MEEIAQFQENLTHFIKYTLLLIASDISPDSRQIIDMLNENFHEKLHVIIKNPGFFTPFYGNPQYIYEVKQIHLFLFSLILKLL